MFFGDIFIFLLCRIFNRKIYRHHKQDTQQAIPCDAQLRFEPVSIDNCIMRACSTDDICTHATRMLYTITMEMKLYLVPLFYCPWFDWFTFWPMWKSSIYNEGWKYVYWKTRQCILHRVNWLNLHVSVRHFVMWIQQSCICSLIILQEIPFCVQISYVFYCF